MLYAEDHWFELEPVVVTADRLPTGSASEPFTINVVEPGDLRRAPQLRLDDILRNAVPGFSLFRRSSSRVAHPTAQGVSLRNVGPNGAGRTLVLLDGIPLNDPFAGWVPWSRVPPSAVGEIIVTPGGGAGLFGNAALAGTIHLSGEERSGNFGELVGIVGNRETFEASLNARLEAKNFSLTTIVERFETGGYPVLQADQRGPVDTSADASSWVWQSRLEWKSDEQTRLAISAGGFQEDRHNGTRFTRNSSAGEDVSATWDRIFPELDAHLRLQGYAQRRTFRSTFSSVNADRSGETPALDQFDVPATAAGGSAVWSQQLGRSHRLIGGADFRWVEGETHEHFFRIDDAFGRSRNAGGRQFFLGAFIEENWRVADPINVVVGGRIDYWRQFDGLRIERDRMSGARLRDDRFGERDGLAPNARLGVTASLARSVRARGAIYSGFRVPTLNELYRPFRVGNDITEANPGLDPERLLGAELGGDWEPVERFSFSLTGFYNRMHDAIGNVTLGEGPGTFEPGGFVPAGGILRQRRNLDQLEVAGIETKLTWRFAAGWRLRAQYLHTHAVVVEASGARQLEGKRLAQAPGHVAVAALEWTPGRWLFGAQVRYVGRQFEDDLNTLPLAHFATVDLTLGYEFNEHFGAMLKVENLLDREIEVGKSGSGLVSIGPPRLLSVRATVTF